MSGLRVRFWGVRGSHPCPGSDYAIGGNTPCVEVRFGAEDPIIIDAGSGIIPLGRQLVAEAEGPLRLHLLVSHLHWDHIEGLPFFPPLYRPEDELVALGGLAEEELRRGLVNRMSPPHFPVHVDDAAASLRTGQLPVDGVDIGSVRVQGVPLHHPQGCTGFRLDSPAGTIVYASDHEPGNADIDTALVELCRGADALVVDAQYTPEQMPERAGWGHGSWLSAIQLASAAGVPRLLLFHHDPEHDDETLEAMLRAAREHHRGVELAREGVEVLVGH